MWYSEEGTGFKVRIFRCTSSLWFFQMTWASLLAPIRLCFFNCYMEKVKKRRMHFYVSGCCEDGNFVNVIVKQFLFSLIVSIVLFHLWHLSPKFMNLRSSSGFMYPRPFVDWSWGNLWNFQEENIISLPLPQFSSPDFYNSWFLSLGSTGTLGQIILIYGEPSGAL